jgi:hypothetical protein
MYFINKQMIPGNNLIWVLKISESDTIYSFNNLDEANSKKQELQNLDLSGRRYKVSLKKEDGTFSDI